jgi:3-hydroxyacyl-CoA dehydrogenase
VRAAAELPFKEGMVRERELFEELASGTQAPAMQYQFFSERSVSTPPPVENKADMPKIYSVGVVGGGTMVGT